MIVSEHIFLSLLILHPALGSLAITPWVLLHMGTLQVPRVTPGPWVCRRRSPIPHTGAPGLPGRVVQLPGDPHPAPGHPATLGSAPVPAAICLGPLHIAGWEHLLLHILLVPLFPGLLSP